MMFYILNFFYFILIKKTFQKLIWKVLDFILNLILLRLNEIVSYKQFRIVKDPGDGLDADSNKEPSGA